MKVKIITANSPSELENLVNYFIESNNKIISISYAIGAFPSRAEFSALILFERI